MDNLSLYSKTSDIEKITKAEEECHPSACRVRDILMIQYAKQENYPLSQSYMLDSYLIMFENAVANSPVEISIGDIEEIYNQENLCIVSCHIKITGTINAEFTDLFHVKKGKISLIKSTNN